MNLIQQLPKSEGKDVIWVVVDRLSMLTFLPFLIPAALLVLLKSLLIIYKWCPCKYCQSFVHYKICIGANTEYVYCISCQSDGKSEVLNRCLEHSLRSFIWQSQKYGAKWLPLAEW